MILLRSHPAALKEMADCRRETLTPQEALLKITKRAIVRGIAVLMPCLPILKTILWIKTLWQEIWAHGTMDHVIHTSVAWLLIKTSTHNVVLL